MLSKEVHKIKLLFCFRRFSSFNALLITVDVLFSFLIFPHPQKIDLTRLSNS